MVLGSGSPDKIVIEKLMLKMATLPLLYLLLDHKTIFVAFFFPFPLIRFEAILNGFGNVSTGVRFVSPASDVFPRMT